MSRIDRVGERFGRLLITRFVGTGKNWTGIWECICDCGRVTNVQYNNLYSGITKSCGCLKRERTIERSTKHGLTGGHGNYTRPYRIWLNMRRRCHNKNDRDFPYYGGRGIHTCPEWDDYKVFHDWAMANGYGDTLTIERKDNNGNYEPSNCKWATRKEQARNMRSNHLITFNGVTKTLAEWAEDMGVCHGTILHRIEIGWLIKDVVAIPAMTNKKVEVSN